MRLSKKVFKFLIVAFFVSIGGGAFARIPQETQKIKIISACQINGKWTFHLFDGVKGKRLSVKQGRRHALGYQIKSFDQSTQTAVIISPYGTFTISMNEHKPTDDTSSQDKKTVSQTDSDENSAENTKSTKPKNTISRREILNRIK